LPNTTVILDEAHYAKNEESARHYRAAEITAQAARVYLLTGTPLKSRPPDLWGVLAVAGLAHEAFGDAFGFDYFFPSSMIQVRKSRFLAWGKPREGVADALRGVMLRRLKVDVLKDLPAKRWDTLPVTLDPAAAAAVQSYEIALGELGLDLADLTAELLEEAEKSGGALPAREEFSKACAELARVKLAAVIAEVEAHERDLPDDPLIVWSRHVDPLKVLGARPGWGTIHGGVGASRRLDLITRFQAGELRGLALSIGAAGTAITLTACDRAIFLDRSWSPADNVQAEDRIHRIGQDRPCRYTDLVADHALDRHLFEVLRDKKEAIAESVDAAATR
jgi:SWI/SNF-related matrix-associated actin-dependent regulator 1 of chromatin subfamily A